MRFLELLAVTDAKQEIVIVGTGKEINQQNSCLYLWECNIHHERNVISLKIKDNLMYVMLRI